MTYRESDYDPNAYPAYGPPLRPYNKVQWTGAALIVVGIGVDLLYFAGRLGWTPQWIDSPAMAMAPLILGAILVNSRREVVGTRTPNRRTLVIIAWALAAFALALTALLYFKGA